MYSDESGTEAETDICSTESETEVETDVDYCDTDDLLKRFTIAIINRVLTPFNFIYIAAQIVLDLISLSIEARSSLYLKIA